MLTLGLVAFALGAEPSALLKAQAHLESGAVEEVLFDLDGQTFQGADRAKAALVLARAARKSVEARDGILGLQLAQMALKHDPAQALALEAGARAALLTQQFEAAEKYADQWIAASAEAEPRLLRAQIAEQQGDWSVVVKTLEGVKGQSAERSRARAAGELDQKNRSLSELKRMEASLTSARQRESREPSAAPPRDRTLAIIYSAPGCQPCEKVKALLTRNDVAYFVKDIDREPESKKELAEKQRRAGIPVSFSVPWTDLNGVLIGGYDPVALQNALPKAEGKAERPRGVRGDSSTRIIIYASGVDALGAEMKRAIGSDPSIVIKDVQEDRAAALELERKKAAAGLEGKAGGKLWIDVGGKLSTANSFSEALRSFGHGAWGLESEGRQ